MTEEIDRRRRRIKQLWLALALLVFVAAVLIVPPLVSVSRYKSRITQLMSTSLGRPVRLSSVSVRALPWPSFVLTDLTVEEDPAYGAEPILHASSVVASIRLLSLWRGRLEIGSVSVDEASLNLVRTPEGRWNLDPLFRSVAAKAQPGAGAGEAGSRNPRRLPSLEATNSRINIKNGAEKLPFSLLSTDLSFWQDNPGEWGMRLRGQPARTDLSLDLADTGVVRLEARGGRAPELRQMPVHLDLEWREAQLGQLTRLLFGADPGWRGDLTGEMHLDGTADAAQVKARLRAEGVHRAEFAPATPMDFDANCAFVYHYTNRALENLACDSPLGTGRIHLAGNLAGQGSPARLSVELAGIPVQAGLDALRTVRSGFGPGLEARGTVSGKIAYAEDANRPQSPGQKPNAKAHPAPAAPLTGSFTVEGFQLSEDQLTTPIRLPRLVLEPVAALPGQAQPQALVATVDLPAGAPVPLTVSARLALSGYQLALRGQAGLARARELARVASMRNAAALDGLAGEPMTVDLTAAGRWMPAPQAKSASLPTAPVIEQRDARRLTGTLVLHNANWKTDYLANHVEIAQATLHLGPGEIRWDPVEFSYGPVKGTATLATPEVCATPEPCLPHFALHFDALDATAIESAILGAHERGTLLSTLIQRLRPTTAPAWPRAEATITAGSLTLDPVTLTDVTATVRTTAAGAEIESLDAAFLGGTVHATGSLETGDKPAWTVTAAFQKLNPVEAGQLLHIRFTGTSLDADGKIELSGYTGKDLAASAKGALHFDWRHGSIGAVSGAAPVPPALARFDRWTGNAEIDDGAITVKENQVQQGARKRAAEATITLDTPPHMTFAPAKEAPKKR